MTSKQTIFLLSFVSKEKIYSHKNHNKNHWKSKQEIKNKQSVLSARIFQMLIKTSSWLLKPYTVFRYTTNAYRIVSIQHMVNLKKKLFFIFFFIRFWLISQTIQLINVHPFDLVEKDDAKQIGWNRFQFNLNGCKRINCKRSTSCVNDIYL